MSATAFELEVGPLSPDRVFVTAFEATEALSRPFRLDVDFFPLDGEPVDLQDLLGKDASFRVPSPNGERWFHGEVHGARSLGEHGGRRRYQLRIGPRLLRLDQIKQSRIFQEKTVVEVVSAVLDGSKVKHREAISGSPAPLEFCVQYRESDFAFVSRLLEREGLFYFFEHAQSEHTLVIGDGSNAFADMAGGDTLPFRREGEAPEEEYVHLAAEVHRLRTDGVVLKDFDPLRPALDVNGKANPGKLEWYDYPAEATATAAISRLATARMQEAAQGKLTVDVRTHSPRLQPGALFSIAEHPEDRFNQKLLVVEVRHGGAQRETLGAPEAFADTYRNEARCLPEGTPYRPRRRTPVPKISGLQTAIVAGASGEEIHPDEHGRVKVQFHWDRQGKKDDKSSCWIRVAQSWGGPGFGALYLPRVGQEVLVRFLEGNPDRPLICGSVYNGEQPPPAKLPGQKTQSTLQSSSSPGGGGNNELRFEDAARDELISLHAQKDLTLDTLNDKGQAVRNDESLWVKHDRKAEIHRHLSHEVKLKDDFHVQKDQTNTVSGHRTGAIAGQDTETVTGSQNITVGGSLTVSAKATFHESVILAKALAVGAAATTLVTDTHSVGVTLLRTETIAGARSEILGGSRDESVEKDRKSKVVGEEHLQTMEELKLDTTQDFKVEVNGSSELGIKEELTLITKKVEVKADSKVNLIVGGKLLVSVDSGGVKINAKTITVEGK